MTTIILTYRNRQTSIVRKCLDSLQNQSLMTFQVVLVNYGSHAAFTKSINTLASHYDFVTIINCRTEGELWCKSRAINIALKQIKTSYVFVGDVDMIFHPEFIQKLEGFKKVDTVTYFQVGFLSKQESNKTKDFLDYKINFKSTEEATGMTFFNTEDLLEINGYDEFYKGWGAEDTDVHIRLRHAVKTVNFYDDEVLMLHQWHPKHYRTKNSSDPFHPLLEQINHAYLEFIKQTKKVKANCDFNFGVYNEGDYDKLKKPEAHYKLTNREALIKAFINNVLLSENNKVVCLSITRDENYKSLKQVVKGFLGKKTILFLTLQEINDLLLETVVHKLRNSAYSYQFDQGNQTIELTIKL